MFQLLLIVKMQVCVIMYKGPVFNWTSKCMQVTCKSFNDMELNWLLEWTLWQCLHCLPSGWSINTILIMDCIVLWYVLGPEEVFIIIHNIDGSMLRSKKVSRYTVHIWTACVLIDTTRQVFNNQTNLLNDFLWRADFKTTTLSKIKIQRNFYKLFKTFVT